MGTTAAPDASWLERTLLALGAATVVLLLAEAAIAGVLAALFAGLGGAGLILAGLGATLLGFVGWGVAGLAAALLALAAVRAGELAEQGRLALAGGALLVVGVAATIANPAGGMLVGADAFDPRPLGALQQAVGVVALVAGTLGTGLIAVALGGDVDRVAAFAGTQLVSGGLAVAGLSLMLGAGPAVGAAGSVVAQVVLLTQIAAVWPEAGAAGGVAVTGGEE